MISPKADFLILIIVAAVAYRLGANNSETSTRMATTPSGTTLVDAATGIAFDVTWTSPKKTRMTAVGVGTRKKAILNVYSLAFYVSGPLERALSEGSPPCSTIQKSSAAKAVMLTFHMGVGPEKIADAISRLEGVDRGILDEFHDMIVKGVSGKMKKGESMTFEWRGADTIAVTARSKTIGEMKDKALAQGVLGLYVGPDSVSPSLRHDLGCT